jgi:long-chain fatty acid transport protein
MLYNITKNVSFGASYLSEVRHKITNGKLEYVGATNSTQSGSANISLPAMLKLGLAWKKDSLTLEAGAQWTEWRSYRTLAIDLANGTSIERKKNWHNAWAYRFGGQYTINKYFDFRAGIMYDETPIPRTTLDPLVPSGNRWLYCVGLGSHIGNLTIDLAASYLDDQNRRWNNPAGYVKLGPATLARVTGRFQDTSAMIFGLSTSYKF